MLEPFVHSQLFGLICSLSSDTCCSKIEAKYLSGDGEAYLEYPKLYQEYKIEPGYINGKPHYTSDDGKYALRWDGNKDWNIGEVEDR